MADDSIRVSDDKGRPFMYLNIGHVITMMVAVAVGGTTYGLLNGHQQAQDDRLTRVESQVDRITTSVSSIERNVSYMAGRIGQQRGGDNSKPAEDMQHGEVLPPEVRLPPG
jgi:hypothetical protein